jgi:hypothetical protein
VYGAGSGWHIAIFDGAQVVSSEILDCSGLHFRVEIEVNCRLFNDLRQKPVRNFGLDHPGTRMRSRRGIADRGGELACQAIEGILARPPPRRIRPDGISSISKAIE